jgi:hypothetical protein
MAGIPPAGASLAGVHKTRVLVTQSKMGFDGEFPSGSDQYCSPFTTLMQVGEVLDIVQIYYARDHTTPLRAHRGKTFNFPTSGDDQSGGDFRTSRDIGPLLSDLNRIGHMWKSEMHEQPLESHYRPLSSTIFRYIPPICSDDHRHGY